MKEWIRQFLLIKTAERRAIVTLVVLIFIALLIFLFLPSIFPPKVSDINFKELIDSTSTETAVKQEKKVFSSTTKNEWNLHEFDPNTVTKNELVEMGFSEKLAAIWTNYTSKGAKFYHADDVKKLYGMNDEIYSKIENYIEIPTSSSTYTNTPIAKENIAKTNTKITVINLNEADTSELMKLPMIGSKRAQMIVKYRNLLGGFIQMEQLKEVYGLNDTVYDAIKNRLFIEKGFQPIKVPINFRAEKDLMKHPYIKPVAKVIANYKKEHGPFESKEDLKKLYGMDAKTLEKILPYINFDLE